MIENPTLRAIRERRSVRNFTPEPVTDEQLEAILEAGRWAPSARNSQPWEFVVVRDPQIRSEMGDILRRATFAWKGFATAPVMIVVSVDQSRDPDHFVEDGAVATQNLCLAAQSLGLASSWAGIQAKRAGKTSVVGALRTLLGLPRTHRIVAVVPVGTSRHATSATRRPLAEMVHYNRFLASPDAATGETPSASASTDDESRHLFAGERRRGSAVDSGRFL